MTGEHQARSWGLRPARGREAALLVAVLVLAAALRLLHLGGQSLWIDEVFQIVDASAPWDDFLGGYLAFDVERTHKSPLSLALHRLWLQLGSSEAFLRLPSAAFSVIEIGVLFALARVLFGPVIALAAALLLAVSPLHIWYAQELRYYSLWTLITTCSFLILALAWRRSSIRKWIAYAASMVVGAASFLLMAAVAPLHWLSAALLARRPETPRAWLRGFLWVQGVAFLVVASPLLLRLGGDIHFVVGTPRDPQLLAAPYTFFTFVAGFSAGPSVRDLHFAPGMGEILSGHPELILFFAVFAPLALWGAWRVWRHTPARELLLPWAFGMPLMVLAVSLVFGNTYNVRYALPALTPFTLVLAVGIVSVPAVRARAGAWAAVALCIGFSLTHYYLNPYYAKEDARGAVAEIRSGEHAGATVAITGQITPAVGYYGGAELDLIQLRDCRARTPEAVEVGYWAPHRKDITRDYVPAARFEEAPVMWLLHGRDWRHSWAECLEWLQETHQVAERHTFAGVELFLLTRHAGGREAEPVRTVETASDPPGGSGTSLSRRPISPARR